VAVSIRRDPPPTHILKSLLMIYKQVRSRLLVEEPGAETVYDSKFSRTHVYKRMVKEGHSTALGGRSKQCSALTPPLACLGSFRSVFSCFVSAEWSFSSTFREMIDSGVSLEALPERRHTVLLNSLPFKTLRPLRFLLAFETGDTLCGPI
jgi:hypothetical protein